MTPSEAIEAYITLEKAMATTNAANDSEKAANTTRFKEAFATILRGYGMEGSLMDDDKTSTSKCKTYVTDMFGE